MSEVSWGFGHDVELIQASRAVRGGSRATGSCVARAGAAVAHLPAFLAKASSSLERRWAGPAGGPGAGRQVSFSIFSCFLFF